MCKVNQLELWWQLYVTSLPQRDVRHFMPLYFCWIECTKEICLFHNNTQWLDNGWTISGSNLRRKKKSISLPKRPNRFWCPPTYSFNGQRFSRGKAGRSWIPPQPKTEVMNKCSCSTISPYGRFRDNVKFKLYCNMVINLRSLPTPTNSNYNCSICEIALCSLFKFGQSTPNNG
jgi:hypothetical protein